MLRWLWLSLAILALDQVSKQWVDGAFTLYESLEIIPFFNFTLLYNEGAAFSFLSDQGGWQRWFFIVMASAVTLILVLWLSRLQRSERLIAASLGLIIGGALGNLLDRILHGHVIDFLDFYYPADSCLPLFHLLATPGGGQCHWPAFNVADSAVFVGVALMLLDTFFSKQKPE